MITTLHIKNIGIIDDLSVDFNQGFNVLTGETGAGKTLIIDSLGIIAGGRFSKEMIRNGENHSFVEVCIYMPESEFAVDGNVIVSREVYSNGRNSCRINGRLVTVAQLKDFMKDVIDIHGQHDNQAIMESSKHIQYLDCFAEGRIKDIKNEYLDLFLQYNNIKSELKKNYGDDKERERRLDLLKYQLEEIEQAKLKIGEEETLEDTRKIILNSEKIVENLSNAENQIENQVIDGINVAIKSLEKIENLDEIYKEKLDGLKTIYYDLQEISRDIVDEKEKIDFDEETRGEIENRLDIIFSLKRKYGNTISEILQYKEDLRKQIEGIENLEEYTEKLKKQKSKLEEKMLQLCENMNEIRIEYANKLSEKINGELQELEMKNAEFKVNIEWEDREFNSNGLNKIEFLIKTNVGEEYKPLIKIASGGEISRIMLAIKSVLADVDKVAVMVFDEIDTGISGIAAKAVGEKMKNIAKKHQIFVVTHLAVIAAAAEYNYYISKQVQNEKVKTIVKCLNEEEVIEEIARIASGDKNEVALEHARELRRLARKEKFT